MKNLEDWFLIIKPRLANVYFNFIGSEYQNNIEIKA